MSRETNIYERPLQFVDLQAQRHELGGCIDLAIKRVLDHGKFIMGPEVDALERALAEYAGVSHVTSCASGTDALLMALMAWNIGRGDAVFVPTFTFAASAEVVALLGATPVFVDIEPTTFNMSPASLERAVDVTSGALKPKVVMPVDMFGLPADYEAIEQVCAAQGLLMLADCAQSFGASTGGKCSAAMGHMAGTSFFPAKPLGCYGDGGAIFTNDPETDSMLRSLRVHGQGQTKYDNVRIGINGRLDTIQAAVLLEKLKIFDDELSKRRAIAERYSSGLADVVAVPSSPPGMASAWAQYTIQVEGRDAVAGQLKEKGIPTAVYYAKPLHQQPAYRAYPTDPAGLTVAERLSQQVLSLPMHPYLEEASQTRIIEEVRAAVGRRRTH